MSDPVVSEIPVGDLSPADLPPHQEDAQRAREDERTTLAVEAIMDSHRLRGEMRLGGVPRRLVDILNSAQGGSLMVHDCEVDDPFKADDTPRRLVIVQMLRDAILFAMPRGGVQSTDPFEAIQKAPVPASVVVPGWEISGNAHLRPGSDAASVPMIGQHHFIAITEATISAAQGSTEVWHEPIVLVNMSRALLYGPR